MIKQLVVFFLILSCSTTYSEPHDPSALFLTWQGDPTTTMTICWLSDSEQTTDGVEFRKAYDSAWHVVEGFHTPLPEEMPYLYHRVSLHDLEANCDYVFKVDPEGVEYRFRTLPNNTSTPFRFIVGGDMYNGNSKTFLQMNSLAASYDPMFVLIGGDIAYAHGKDSSHEKLSKKLRWVKWMEAWKEQMVAPDGRLIPLIPCIGNHDVTGWFNQSPSNSPYFYIFFPFPGLRGYDVLDIANFISIIVLDSGHTHSISGDQTSWIAQALKKRQHIPHKFALYHQAAFPSFRNFNDNPCKQIRQHWVPLFEKYGLATAFEHHEHCYKRSPLILNNQVDSRGILYLGDGGWAVSNIRQGKDPETTWYLEKTISNRHFILVSINGSKRHYQTINIEGEQIDELDHPSRQE